MRKFVCLAAMFFVLPAQARTFCCEVNGRTYCDEGVPPQCYGKAYRELGGNGQTLRQYEAPLTPEQKAKRDAELAQKRIDDERAAEEERRNRKLLSTYITVRDLDEAHAHALLDMEKALSQIQTKLAEAKQKKKQLDSEGEFYNKRRPMPVALKEQLRANETETKAQEKAAAERSLEMDASKKRFAEERVRYLLLTAKNQPSGSK